MVARHRAGPVRAVAPIPAVRTVYTILPGGTGSARFTFGSGRTLRACRAIFTINAVGTVFAIFAIFAVLAGFTLRAAKIFNSNQILPIGAVKILYVAVRDLHLDFRRGGFLTAGH